MNRPSLLFVSLGCICRSPMAKALLRDLARQAGVPIAVEAAGTCAIHAGDGPDRRARLLAQRQGVDMSGITARTVTAADFHRHDWIVAFDQQNLKHLKAMAPRWRRARLSLLMDWVPGGRGQALIDPYHGDAAEFASLWDEVELATAHLLAKVVMREFPALVQPLAHAWRALRVRLLARQAGAAAVVDSAGLFASQRILSQCDIERERETVTRELSL